MEKIAVLLAVYNGRKWIDEQLNSILEQDHLQKDIFISVDLSDDGSFQYLVDKYSYLDNIYILPYGERYGSAGNNFYRLVLDVDFSSYDYISFADQDDIWNKTKLSTAVSTIKRTGCDAYSSNVTAFWENGKQCLIDKAQPQVEYDFLFEAAGPGCTYVFKNELAVNFKNFLRTNSDARGVVLHDWLLYAYARSNGYNWFISKEPSMLYRQHSNNEVGANNNFKAACKRIKLSRQGWYRGEVLKLATMFIDKHSKLLHVLNTRNLASKFYLIINVLRLRRRNRDRFAIAIFIFFNLM